MRQRLTRMGTGLAGAALVASLALPATAAATTGEPIAQTGGASATLPLLGTSLTVDVTLDSTGNITSVVLTPPDGFTETTSEATKVRFDSDDGATRVAVKAKGDRLSISARTASLADLVGSGSWSADLFATGTPSVVDYTIGDDAGSPTLSIDAITPAAGIDAVPVPVESSTEDDEASVSGGAVFSYDGYTKRLKISVSVEEDGTAHIRITLTGKDRQRLSGTLEELGGARTWSAHLCDGTPVTVSYHVDAGAMAVFDGATGGEVTLRPYSHGFQATFDGTKVGVKVGLTPTGDGTWALSGKGFSGRCNGKAGEHGAKSEGWTNRQARDDDGEHSQDQERDGKQGGTTSGDDRSDD
jgi:hypothetical protein